MFSKKINKNKQKHLQLATLTGHTYRVLYLAGSPDGQTIVTGAGDQTLRFWNVFPPNKFGSTYNGLNNRIDVPFINAERNHKGNQLFANSATIR